MEYVLHILILVGIYIILSTSLNLIAGYTGLLSIAHAAFFGIGAYITAIIAINHYSPFLVNILYAVIISGILGAAVGIPSLRIRDDYFVIATIAFQIIMFSIFNNWMSVTRGPLGIPDIPSPEIFGLVISSPLGLLILVTILCATNLWLINRVVNSPFGRVLKTIREDEVFAKAAGKNVAIFKIIVFIISSGMAAMAGVIYAYYMSFIDPNSFTLMESIFIITIVIIGGAGSLQGPVLGAIVLVLFPEFLRLIGLPSSIASNVRQIVYGGVLVGFMMWRPHGLLGKYNFQNLEPRE